MKECLILANNEKSVWYQELDFRTGFLLSKSRSFKKSAQRPELTQIIAATKVPEYNYHIDPIHHTHLFIGTQQHLNSDWVVLLNGERPNTEVTDDLKKNFKNLKIDSIKILVNDTAATTTEQTLMTSLKSSFPEVQFVYWPH